MQIVPGAVMQGEQNSAAGSPQRSISFNVNGVSRLQNNTRIDGASVVYPWLPTNTAYVPTAEAIQEAIENILCNRRIVAECGHEAMETARQRPWSIYGQELAVPLYFALEVLAVWFTGLKLFSFTWGSPGFAL